MYWSRTLEGTIDVVIGVFFHLTAIDLRPRLETKIGVDGSKPKSIKIGPCHWTSLFDNAALGHKLPLNIHRTRSSPEIEMIAGAGGHGTYRVSVVSPSVNEAVSEPHW